MSTAQSVKGVEKADLLEIIDHHRICDIRHQPADLLPQ